jgi:hydrogenase nickel incorporation protein HypB
VGRFHRHADGTVHSHDHDHDHDGHDDRDVGDHTGYETGGLRVEVLEQILGENDRTADANRTDFTAHALRAVNVMSSPGAGKTTLLAAALRHLDGSVRIGILEGDIETPLDADRLRGLGVPVALINTANGFGGECHLDATMVRSVLHDLPLADLDLVIIENVGNLVCPAEFDVGESARALV